MHCAGGMLTNKWELDSVFHKQFRCHVPAVFSADVLGSVGRTAPRHALLKETEKGDTCRVLFGVLNVGLEVPWTLCRKFRS